MKHLYSTLQPMLLFKNMKNAALKTAWQ